MRWTQVRADHPDQWLVIEAIAARSEGQRRVIDRMAVVAICADGSAAMHSYRELHAVRPERELYFVHTATPALAIDERLWLGIRPGARC